MKDETSLTNPNQVVNKVKALVDKKTKAERKSKESSQFGMARPDLFNFLKNQVELIPNPFVGKFTREFKVVQMDRSTRIFIEIVENKICYFIKDEAVACAVCSYANDILRPMDPDLWLDYKKAEDFTRFFKASSVAIEKPAAVAWVDEDIYCFSKLPFSYVRNNECPVIFAEIGSRMKNWRAFCTFIGSLFYPEADLQQYLWLFGEGSNGKGDIARLLKKVFQNACETLETANDAHWTEQLINCRVGVFPDVSSTKFVTSGFFKSKTGGDAIRINPKNKSAYSILPHTKFIFLSNEMPALSSEKADLRRIIFCEIDPIIGEAEASYFQRLWNDAQGILSYCRDQYEAHVATCGHGPIPIDDESLENLTAEEDDYFQAVFDKYFELTNLKHEYAKPQVAMTSALTILKDQKQWSKFCLWMKRTYNIKRKVVRFETTREKRMVGLKSKSYAAHYYGGFPS